ncbi:MAG: type II secretion system F family protein, partial [Planctomycetaceae bacterium]
FYLPEIGLRLLMRSRQEKVFLGLPDALDLLVVCVEAGLGLDAGMRRVADELGDSHPEVCAEFHMANRQLQIGRKRREVLHDLGVRTGVDDMKALAAILIQADKFGSSIAQALRVQSDSMRVKRRQLAEERAAQTAVKMIFPLVLFIFPGIFVVLVGPAAIMMINGLLTEK